MFVHLFISRSSAREASPAGKKAVCEQGGQASELKPDMPLPF